MFVLRPVRLCSSPRARAPSGAGVSFMYHCSVKRSLWGRYQRLETGARRGEISLSPSTDW